MLITKHSKLSLYPLQVREDKKNFIVEDVMSGEFYEMPSICIDAITMMNEGKRLYLIEETLKEKYLNEQVDIESFTEDLLEMGLVKSLDGETIPREMENKKKNDGLVWIPPKVGRFFFNRYSRILYTFAIVISVLLFIFKPELFPMYHDIFLFDLMMYNILVFLSLTFLLVLIHEMGHVLAVRAEGLPAKIELGHRLFFIVLETDMSRVWSLPSEKRYRLYLAGLYFDSVVMLLALVVQFVFADDYFAVGIAKLIVLNTFIRILYQFCVYMKTDMYYVLENWTGCYNLMENGQISLKRWLPFLPIVDNSKTFDGEEKLVRPYAIFYFFGVIVTAATTVFYNIPLIIHAGILVMPGLLQPVTSFLFWDAIVFYLQFILIFGLLIYSWSKKYRLNH